MTEFLISSLIIMYDSFGDKTNTSEYIPIRLVLKNIVAVVMYKR